MAVSSGPGSAPESPVQPGEFEGSLGRNRTARIPARVGALKSMLRRQGWPETREARRAWGGAEARPCAWGGQAAPQTSREAQAGPAPAVKTVDRQ